MRDSRTPSTVTLTTLDLSSTLAETQTFIAREQGEDHTARYGFDYAAVEHDGTLYVLCTEGVGWEVTEAEPLRVDVYASRPGFMAIMPCAEMTMSPAEVRAAMTGEVVALHDFIRSFGARLEANYAMWDRLLSRGSRALASTPLV